MPMPSRDPGAGPRGPPPALARRRHRPLLFAVTGVAVAAAAGFAARGVWPATSRPAAVAANVPVDTATVVRTDVSAQDVVAGTLGYAGSYRVVNELAAGIVTWLPGPRPVVRRGQPLFRLAGQPVVLLYGAVPAWRDFGARHDPGPRRARAAAEPGRARVRPGPAPTASSAGPPRPRSNAGSRRAA